MRPRFALPAPRSYLGWVLSSGLALSGCSTRVEDEAAFRYHADSGKCLNAAGEEGRNPYDSAAIHGSKRAECVNLSYLELILLEKGEVSSTDDTLKGWDFRGAGFYGSQLHFNHIIGADFRGAGLSGLDFGYAVLEGKVDSFTAIPREGCVLNGTSLRCVR